ncbi:NHL repeat-containing protein [Candidatus Binatus sp.]|uniref:NHL repeat-containing protein n=1 Tax=Candidatus Binatus sp. TaxID=2811406 RepID=UPI003C3B2B4A
MTDAIAVGGRHIGGKVLMKLSTGGVRLGVIAIFCAAALPMAGLYRFSGRAYSADLNPALFVTDRCSYAVTAYSAASNGDVSPLAPAPTGLSIPEFVAVDASGNIYATNSCDGTVTIYAARSNGDAAPIAVIGGSNTGMSYPQGIALDSGGNIYVADENGRSVLVYPRLGNSTGALNEVPIAAISGSSTGLTDPEGIAVDSEGNIYVADGGNSSAAPPVPASVFVYAAGSSGNVAPMATISGSNSGLSAPYGIVLDSSGNFYTCDIGLDTGIARVLVYPPLGSSTGLLNESPTATISGTNTLLGFPWGIALDSSRNIYVASFSGGVTVYSPVGNSTGILNEVPIADITGSNTGQDGPNGIALDSSGNIYVADGDADSVLVYPAGSNGNVPPIATINASVLTGVSVTSGIALDSAGNIYLSERGNPYYPYGPPPSVLVYPAGSNGNAAPIATISGRKTGLKNPVGIAVDSLGKIYVADARKVLVYPAGSNGDAAPFAVIGLSKTGKQGADGIAVDSSGNIYVAEPGNALTGGPILPKVYVYAALTSRRRRPNEHPIATITGSNSGLISINGIAVDSSANIYVAQWYPVASVFVYPAVGSSTGRLDESPIATISGTDTDLGFPLAIALDSSGNIYVVDIDGFGNGTAAVFVYPAGSNGNVAPVRIINGPQTELGFPLFLAIQPVGK